MEEFVLMPIEVPSAPKVYTTKYDNFRGVDFTNDPSNVWSHRSPNALNMMPDLAGNPWKRTGWKIMKSAQDFRDCYNDTTSSSYSGKIVPIKTNYFEIGGEDYLAITNNLGLFFYSKFIGDSAKDEPDLLYIDSYYGEVGTANEEVATTIEIAPDANRAFFFEGQGLAGFYIFCTTTDRSDPNSDPVLETSLFRFDGEVLRKVDPYVPQIMIGKEAGDSAGTIFENPNMLTTQRICQFYGNNSVADYVLPEQADPDEQDVVSVEVLINGVWFPRTYATHYTVDHSYAYAGQTVTKITFTAGNIPETSDIDNVRITYNIKGDVVEIGTYTTPPKSITVVTQTRQTRTITYADDDKYSTPWINAETTETKVVADWAIPNVIVENGEPQIDVYMQTEANTWTASPILSSIVDASYTSYSNILSVDVTDLSSYWCNVSTTYTNPTQTSSNVTSGSSGSADLHASGISTSVTTVVEQQYEIKTKTYPIKVIASQRQYSSTHDRQAFEQCKRAMVYGNGLINSVFMAGSTMDNYRSRVWWSYPTNPAYFPDTNYLEAGSNDTNIAGMMKVGEYLGIIKQGMSFDSTIYLAYATTFASGTTTDSNGNTETIYENTYAIKSSIGGIGAISNGAFNILNDEPLFLSRNGVMGINPANENEKQVRNRSFFINKKLLEEGSLENAFSFVYKNMYILCVNNHCYVLDGAQKTSWANEKTNLQYECYYWDNVPAQCFAKYNDELWFTDKKGRLCKFKPVGSADSYHDDYDPNIIVASDTSLDIIPTDKLATNPSIEVNINWSVWEALDLGTGQFWFTYGSAGYLHRTILGAHFKRDGFQGQGVGNSGHLDVASSPRTGTSIKPYLHNSEGWHLNGEPISLENYGITITGDPKPNDAIIILVGNPIKARWSTVFDDDGASHYFKNLQKKGTKVSLLPDSSTGVKVYIKKDNNETTYVGEATIRGSSEEIIAPSDFYLKKKAKRYKRLQIIAESTGFDENFGVDEIIKCYTIGNYSRNR